MVAGSESLNDNTLNQSSDFCVDERRNSNIPATPESQTSDTCGSQKRNVGQSIFPTFGLNNHIEDTTITKNEDTEVKTTNIDIARDEHGTVRFRYRTELVVPNFSRA